MKIYDISQTIDDGIAVWPGDRRFSREWTMRLDRGDSCNLSAVSMSVHTGTHMDAPHHFDLSGSDIANVPLAHCVGPARVFELSVAERITAFELEKLQWRDVERALFKTRASGTVEQHFDTDFPYLTKEAAEYLGNLGLRLVGTDAPSVDAFDSKTLPAHHILLSHGIAILEGVRLGQIAPGDYELIALPLRLAGLDGSPVRAILREGSR